MTLSEFLAGVAGGFHEDNLRRLIRDLTPLIKSQTNKRQYAALYLIQAILNDILADWIEDRPVDVAVIRKIEASVTPRIKAVVESADQAADAQVVAMNALVKSYLDLLPKR